MGGASPDSSRPPSATSPHREPVESRRESATTVAAPAERRRQFLVRRRRRVLYSLLAIAAVLVVGTVGFFALTGTGWVDSFYFESMLATGQGPPFALTSDAAKLFASLMAFVSVGTVISTLVLNLGPILGRLWREAVEHVEHELRDAAHDVKPEVRDQRRVP